MQVKELKKIINLVSTQGLINEFVLNKDGTVKGIDIVRTILVDLKYNGILLTENIGFENNKKLKSILDKFADDTEFISKDNVFYLKAGGKEAEIPKRDISTIAKAAAWPEIPYTLEIPNVPLTNLRAAVKNKTEDLTEQFVFDIKDGKLKLTLGSAETGWISEDICPVQTDMNISVKFTVNVVELMATLEKNPTIKMGQGMPMEFSYATDLYTVKYLIAPRTEA